MQRVANSARSTARQCRTLTPAHCHYRRGLNFQVMATRLAVIRPLTRPTMGSVSTNAALAAQPIEENASAKVASRDEVWRRRNWLRRAWTRNQSWIAVAEAALTMTAPALTAAWDGEAKASAAINGQKMTAIAISTTSILARTTLDGVNGAVATRSGASSPEIVSQASPPASCPAAMTMTGVISVSAAELSAKLRQSSSAGGTR